MYNDQQKKQFGFVSIIGKPNVGKSTLINALFNQRISIATIKPQTTRNLITAVYNDDDAQIIFTDTPGYHRARTKLDEQLNIQAKRGVQEADVICFLTDITRELDAEDLELIEHIKKSRNPNSKVILVVSKSETANEQDEIDERIRKCHEYFPFDNHLMVSGLHHKNIDKFFRIIKSYLPEGTPLYDLDTNGSLLPDQFIIAEIIREQCLKLLKQEIPYGIAVTVNKDEYDRKKNVYLIDASISVEKESQKPIVVGAQGHQIKDIGIKSREALLKIFHFKEPLF